MASLVTSNLYFACKAIRAQVHVRAVVKACQARASYGHGVSALGASNQDSTPGKYVISATFTVNLGAKGHRLRSQHDDL